MPGLTVSRPSLDDVYFDLIGAQFMTATTTRSPGALALGLARASVELKTFFRVREAVVFTFSLPIVMLAILGSVFSDEIEGTGITASQLFAAGIIAGGVASTSFVNLGIGIATDRDDGTLKRLRGTPMPVVSYFVGKVLLVLVVSLAEVALLLGAGYLALRPGPADGGLALADLRLGVPAGGDRVLPPRGRRRGRGRKRARCGRVHQRGPARLAVRIRRLRCAGLGAARAVWSRSARCSR